ncbi:ArsR/SmtB family transcription factor [Paenibacillus tengchongensis]|uniref:ArsR/SmtB family transcription factor n=1 Tax=Paenibacillus tengchongensis TaxID=2608684 RepID=UPI00124DEA02|nr:metalloregulator ArsR/SmtB family transcription factor [Paenibacillus tengchongensis]
MNRLDEVAGDLKLLGDKTRLGMLGLLREREWCVCEFVDIFEISQPAVSQHLRKLRVKGIVKESKRGQWVHYSLDVADKPHIAAVLAQLPDTAALLDLLGKKQGEGCAECD